MRKAFVAALLCLAGACVAAEPEVNPVDVIQQAVKRGDHQVIVPPGTYRLSPGIVIRNARDIQIIGDGVTLVFTKLSRAIDFDHCKNVTFRGFTIDYDPLPFTQGKVVAVAADKNSVDVKLDDGYPDQAYSRVDVCDPKTRTRKRGMLFLWGTEAQRVGDRLIRLTKKDLGKTAVVGDLISLSTGSDGGPPHGITLDYCGGITFENVTLHSAPGMGILEGESDAQNRYTNVRIVPGPKPAGATEERLLTTSWDATQCKSSRVGPIFENCEIRDAGDDSWSVQSSDFVLVAARGREAVLGFRDEYCDGPHAGERVRTGLDGVEATVVDCHPVAFANADLTEDVRAKLQSAKQWTFWNVRRRMLGVTFDRDMPFSVGQSVYDPDRQCNGFVLRNCRINSPGRVLVKGGDGVIENNTFIDCHAGVSIDAEVPTEAASGIQNVTIRNNRISGTGYFCPSYDTSGAGCISVVGNNKTRNIVIENNLFDDINGVVICLTKVADVSITGNRFTHLHPQQPTDTGGKAGINQRSVIFASNVTGLKIANNTADALGPFTQKLLDGNAFTVANAGGLVVGSPR